MKIKATNPLFQYGVSAYKGQEVEVNAETGKTIIENGHGIEVKAKKSSKAK